MPQSQATDTDRFIWVLLSRIWSDWHASLHIVKPETVVRWHRQGFRYYWRWKSRHRGRPKADPEIRELIRRMCRANPLWGVLSYRYVSRGPDSPPRIVPDGCHQVNQHDNRWCHDELSDHYFPSPTGAREQSCSAPPSRPSLCCPPTLYHSQSETAAAHGSICIASSAGADRSRAYPSATILQPEFADPCVPISPTVR